MFKRAARRRPICHGVATVRAFCWAAWGGGPLRISMAFACVFAACLPRPAARLRTRPAASRRRSVRRRCVRLLDGRTLTLTDGREVRLAGIEVPTTSRRGGPGGAGRARGRPRRPAAADGPGNRPLRPASSAGIRGRRDGPSIQWSCWRGPRLVAASVGGTACAAAFLSAERRPERLAWPLGEPHITRRRTPRDPGGNPGASGPFRRGRGEGAVGPRKRRHDLRQLRAALVGGLHRHRAEAQRAHVFGRRAWS